MNASGRFSVLPDGGAVANGIQNGNHAGWSEVPSRDVTALSSDDDARTVVRRGLQGSPVIVLGFAAALAFLILGVRYELQLYGDGAIFAYGVAAEDCWVFHWHNISGRLAVYLTSSLPAELLVRQTGDLAAGIALYGALFFSAQLVGLALTAVADRSADHRILAFACASTVGLCPLVYGFPTEMWLAHAVFWPTLAVSHYPRKGWWGFGCLVLGLTTLMLSHGGGVVLAAAILATLVLRGLGAGRFRTFGMAALIAAIVWVSVILSIRPDPYIAKVISTAAFSFIDLRNLLLPVVYLMVGAILGYAAIAWGARRWSRRQAPLVAFVIVAVALMIYWLTIDTSLVDDERYPLRTSLLVGTPVLGALAAAYAALADGDLTIAWPPLAHALASVQQVVSSRDIAAIVLLVALVHSVETVKFIRPWQQYKDAVRALAMSDLSDPELGDPAFVSSDRIGDDLNRLSWSSTTHFLSVLVAPGVAPKRLVVSPHPAYQWLSCQTAKASLAKTRSVPVASRALIAAHACRR